MLHELSEGDFARIKPLLTGERVNIEIKGITAGNNLGWVFVDDLDNPKTALVFSHGQQGFYFVGEVDNPRFTRAIRQTIDWLQPRLAGMDIDFFEYSGTSMPWEKSLEQLFHSEGYSQSNQYVYLYPDLATIKLPDKVDRGIQVVEITDQLLANAKIDTSFIQEILSQWLGSVEKFLQVGSGFCVVCDGSAVSACYTSFVADNQECTLGVDTQREFQGRGFARAATLEMLRKCQAEGMLPAWDCMETNTPSRRLAEGSGFTLGFVYQVYSFKLGYLDCCSAGHT